VKNIKTISPGQAIGILSLWKFIGTRIFNPAIETRNPREHSKAKPFMPPCSVERQSSKEYSCNKNYLQVKGKINSLLIINRRGIPLRFIIMFEF